MIKLFLLVIVVLFFSGCTPPHMSSSGYNSSSSSNNFPTKNDMQLQAVIRTRFRKQKALGFNEGKLYWKLVNALDSKKHTLLSQVSLGELLQHDGDEYNHINCKRVDFCIVDKQFNPLVIVEYNGQGHYSNDSQTRDEIKRVACDSAGIHYVTITHHEDMIDAINRKVLPLLS